MSSSTSNEGMGDRVFYSKAFNELFAGDVSDARSTVEKYFTPQYEQTTDGHVSQYEDFIKHIEFLRSIAETCNIEIVDFVREGRKVAERHFVSGRTKAGKELKAEVYLFGELDEVEGKRLVKAVEATRVVVGDEKDQDLARRTS